MCFLCLWDSRADAQHYHKKAWPDRVEFTPTRFNVQYVTLVDPQKIYLPPLHIKLGLIKNFVKAMNQDGGGFKYLKEEFSLLKSDAKIKAGIFIGPEICKLKKHDEFKDTLNRLKLTAWESFVSVVDNFLGNMKSDDYVPIIKNMLKAYENMGARMSLKIHFLP